MGRGSDFFCERANAFVGTCGQNQGQADKIRDMRTKSGTFLEIQGHFLENQGHIENSGTHRNSWTQQIQGHIGKCNSKYSHLKVLLYEIFSTVCKRIKVSCAKGSYFKIEQIVKSA